MYSIFPGLFGIFIFVSVQEFGSGKPIYPYNDGIKSQQQIVQLNGGKHEHILSRHRRSSNETVDNRSSIEKFYADPNNMAMYLVLPLIILVYGGCSSIYCIYKCRRYIKRQREKRQLNKMKTNMTDVQQSVCSIEDREGVNMPERQNTPAFGSRAASSAALLPHTIDNEVSDEAPLYPKINPTEGYPLEDLEEKQELKSQPKVAETMFIIPPRVNSGTPSKSPRPTGSEKTFSRSNYRTDLKEHAIRPRPVSRNDGSDDLQNDDSRTTSRISGTNSSMYRRSDSKLSSHTTKSYLLDHSEKKQPKMKKFTDLTDSDIKTILNYYSEKKHMPDVIPEDEENMNPIRRTTKKWKYRVFNG